MPDWLKIREAYEASSEAVTQICLRFGVSTGALYKRAKVESWPQRSAVKKKPHKNINPKRRRNEGQKKLPDKVERR